MAFESAPVRGVQVHYGARNTNEKFGGSYGTKDGNKMAEYTFTYDDLPAEGTGEMQFSFPAYSKILSARLEVLTAFAGGTSYNLGLYQSDGTVIDADGIDAAVALASIDARGDLIECDGALIGASIGAAAGELRVAATGTFTAGKAKLVVEYMEEGA